MTAYLTGKWELSGGGTIETGNIIGFRRYCDVINNISSFKITNYNNAWNTDGSEIGRSISYERSSNPGVFSPSFSGSIYSGTLNYTPAGLPTLNAGPYYPSVVSNGLGGWRYDPYTSNLPSVFDLSSSINAGFPSDVEIEIAIKSSSAAATFMKATILNMSFDTVWNTLYLEETIGDGKAYMTRVNVGTSQHPNMQDAIGFATTYDASWRTYPFREGSNGASDYGLSGFRLDSQIPVGTYLLSNLLASGLAEKNGGYFHTTSVTSDYSVS